MEVSDSQQVPEGQTQQQNTQEVSDQTKKEDVVKYDTYKRTVGEAKKAKEEARELRERLQAYEAQQKEREEKELADQENWKKLLEVREQELAEERERRQSLEGSVTNAIKRDAFLNALQGSVPKEYHSLLPLSEVHFNPETNSVDEMSLNSAVENFRKIHHRIIETGNVSKLPNQKPMGAGHSVTDPQPTKGEELRSVAEDISKFF